MENLAIRKLRNDIINTVNASQLPIETKRLVFIEILEKITQEADKQCEIEFNQLKESEAK